MLLLAAVLVFCHGSHCRNVICHGRVVFCVSFSCDNVPNTISFILTPVG